MKIVFKQNELEDAAVVETQQEPFPLWVKCKRSDCKNDKAILYMLIIDGEKELVGERPIDACVWPHDASVIAIYLCTECGSMRARWNQG